MHRRTAPALIVALILPLLVAAGPAWADPGPSPRIATYNAFLLPRALYPNWGQELRADLIARDGVVSGQDVVVLQELFDNASADVLRAGIAEEYPHGTPVVGRSRSGWDATTGYRDHTTTNGGVSVHSVWPIVRREQHVFSRACGSDWFANKGFASVELATPDGPLHVIGTHMQSEDGSCADGEDEDVRTHQLGQIRAVIDAIPDDEPVYVAGDLNIVGGGGEWDRALERLDAVEPALSGAPYSWDPGTNSIAGYDYPGWEPQGLDHVLPIRGGAAPASFTNRTGDVKSEPWSVSSWGRTYTFDDYSDHYPVFGSAG
ncbi:phospholipase C/sphingomyelin phosphodiesterase [Nocardiopsis sp. Huas11]|uniref:sphingomyelin phosphodiesterase n=1 Tax=Nocardiopsis sp. Huas11 TaxID=2183912 RepID=UPI000EAF2A0F|nr:sphingomyelin phosphodiesterase [Nocardiopsis sp. Huas11]RKS05499.1 phospholipase C/sphingomyelin phosphodiesterase [Nocardiopsis sp. Huas11]